MSHVVKQAYARERRDVDKQEPRTMKRMFPEARNICQEETKIGRRYAPYPRTCSADFEGKMRLPLDHATQRRTFQLVLRNSRGSGGSRSKRAPGRDAATAIPRRAAAAAAYLRPSALRDRENALLRREK